MPIAKSFDKDIFISYCHDDNVNPMAKKGWVDVFHEALLWRLKQRLGRDQQAPVIWRDNSLQGNDSFSAVLTEELRRVALVVSVLTPSYVSSPWCKRELEEFSRAAQAQAGLRVDKKMRILKVLKTPVDRDKHPALLQDETGFPFYAPGRDPANPCEYTLSDGDENAALAQRAIDDLAFSIEAVLNAINQQADTHRAAATTALAYAGTTVYLAECHWGLDEARQQIRRELEALGATVLPAGELPLRNPLRFREAVQQGLAASTLAVHLVSALRGAGVADETDDCVVLQNRLAAERSAASGLQRLVWLPEHLIGSAQADDASQQLFIDQLGRDPATRHGAETLTMPLQDLITRIHETLSKQRRAHDEQQLKAAVAAAAAAAAAAAEATTAAAASAPAFSSASAFAPTAAASVAPDDGEPPSVYLLWHPDDEALARTLDDHLYALGFDVLNPLTDPAADEDELTLDHQTKLQQCSAALVCVGKTRESWLNAQLSGLQHAVGKRKGVPMAARGIYIGPPDAPFKSRVRAQGVVVCKGPEGFSADQLQAFVDLVRAAAAPVV